MIESKIKSGKLDLGSQHLASKRLASIGSLSPSQCGTIDQIDLGKNDLTIQCLDSMISFAPLRNLMRVNLAYNNLDRLPAHFFVNLPNCLIFSVANNQIECIEPEALKGAREDSFINLCGNPIKNVQPGAMTVGFNRVTVFCSKSLPENVIDEIRKQLFSPDLKTKLLIKCYEISHKLSSFNGHIPILVIICLAAVCSIVIFPLIVVFQLNPFSRKSILSSVGFTLAVFWLFNYLARKIERGCDAQIIKNSNKLIQVDRRDEKYIQRDMFES